MTDSIISAFKWIGIVVSLSQLQKISSFIWFYFLRPTNGYKLYLRGPAPYALITGATDGIGKGIAKDLYDKGFNLILHGRNEEKMKKVVEELKVLGGQAKEGGDIRILIVDAGKPGLDFEGIVRGFDGLNITIVVHNVGGMAMRPATIDGWAEEEILGIIRLNALFPTLLTRALLPSLRRRSHEQPVLVTYISSLGAILSTPRVPVYSAAKAFISRLSQCLHADERFDSGDSGLSFMTAMVGEVRTQIHTAPVSWTCPSADVFAKTVVNAFGCGKQVVTPYIGHAVGSKLASYLPESIMASILRTEMVKHIERELKRM